MTRDAMRQLLEQHGWQVIIASTVREAVVALTQRVRWVVLDLLLPDGDGLEVLRIVRRKRMPVGVVVVTGVTDASHLRRARALEPEALLHKPTDFQRLLAVLEG